MTDDAPLSDAARLCLDDLGRTDPRRLIKSAIMELIDRGDFTLRMRPPREPAGRPRLQVLQTGARTPDDALLLWVRNAIERTPTFGDGGERVRSVDHIAKHLARSVPKVERAVLQLVLEDLEARGLIVRERRRVVPGTRWVRTAAGDAALALMKPMPTWRGLLKYGGGGIPLGVVLDDGDRLDDLIDAKADDDFDAGLDAGFDASLDASFDAAFDAGAADGSGGGWDSGGSGGNSGGDGGGDAGGGGDGGGGGGGGD